MLKINSHARRELADGYNAVQSGDRNIVLRTASAIGAPLDFARSVTAGLSRQPRTLECRFLYDAQGSQLYERITEQPEYYPTRTEAAILAKVAARLRALCGPVTLLELGSGSAAKTDHLLRAWLALDPMVRYIPVDVSDSALLQASRSIAERHPRARVIGIHGTYEEALALLPDVSPALAIFLGSTLGNFEEEEAVLFLRRLAAALGPEDKFLLGVDLVKDAATLEAAYNDVAGVTAAFTRNLFARMNRELACRLDLESIEHVARWLPEQRQIEILARFQRPQTIHVRSLGAHIPIAAGEEVRVEISRKFELEALPDWLSTCGFNVCETFTDERRWFALLLLEKIPLEKTI